MFHTHSTPTPAGPDARHPPHGSGEGLTVYTRRRLSVLVVDDYPDAADALALLLRLYGHRVTVARTAAEALSVADREPPDAVLLELRLRGIDGWQVARWLREQARVRDLAPLLLVAVTGCGQEEDYRRSIAAGIDLHLVKPVDPHVLRRALARFAIGLRAMTARPPEPASC